MSECSREALLSLCSVTFEVNGKRLIDDISVSFLRSTRTVVLGPNGAGKSLLLRLCHGLLEPTSGEIRWSPAPGGEPFSQAMVFDRPVLLRRSVAGNIRYPLKAKGLAAGECDQRVSDALELAGLEDRARQPAHTLSAGQKQRLSLARAWALKPDVMFLDEPTAHLDLAATRDIETMISVIHSRLAAVILTTHDLAQARRLADHVVFVHKGLVMESGPAAAFFECPQSPEAQHFLKGEMF